MLPAQRPRLLPLVGGGVAVLVLAMFWFPRESQSVPEPVAPASGPNQPPAPPAPEDPKLVEVEALRRKVPKVKLEPKLRNGPGEKGVKAKEKRPSELSAVKVRSRSLARAEEPEEEGPELVPFVVEPILDTSGLPDIDLLARCRYHSRLPGGDPKQRGRAVFRRFRSFVAGRYVDPLTAPKALIVHFDHPGAVPAEFVLGRSSWVASGDGYVARPTLRFEPIEATISIGLEPGAAGRPFRGAVHLLEISPQGDLRVVDEQPLDGRIRRKKKARLRLRRGSSALMAIAVPSSESQAPDLLVPHIPGAQGDYEMLTGVRGLMYDRRVARVVDPFGEPFGGAVLVGVVNENRVAIREAAGGTPVTYRGHVFIHTPTQRSMRFDGTTTSTITGGSPVGLMAVRGTVRRESEGDGVMDLTPVLDSVYDFVIRTPLSDGKVHVMPFELAEGPTLHKGRWIQTYTIPAPVGGIQVERPPSLDLRSNDWRRAKITLTAGDQVIPVTVDEGGLARGCVPPLVPVSVRVESGKAVFTAKVAALRQGSRAIAVPVKVSDDSKTED